MSSFENAVSFFHACEGLRGWQGCMKYVAKDAVFQGQCEPVAELTSIQQYCCWMEAMGQGPLKGCSYQIHASCFDENSKTVLIFATLTGTHNGEGGPVPATGRQTQSHYVYSITMNDQGKIAKLIKIWNAPWAMRELGWAPLPMNEKV